MIRLLTLFALVALSACAKGYQDGDRLEGVNRKVYSFNSAVDRAAIRPVAVAYRNVVPRPVRSGVSNAFSNTGEPLSFINAMLQGKPKRAFRAVDRFVINSTYGILGTQDRAGREFGLIEQPEDFGQTLAVWGVPSGPFLMLPLLGPSSLRDAVGFGVEAVANPFQLLQDDVIDLTTLEQIGIGAARLIDLRAGLIDTADPVIANALDPYATVKSAYIQARTAQIYNGNPPLADAGMDDEFEEFEPEEFEPEEFEPDDNSLGEAIDDPLSPQAGAPAPPETAPDTTADTPNDPEG